MMMLMKTMVTMEANVMLLDFANPKVPLSSNIRQILIVKWWILNLEETEKNDVL